MLELKGTDTQAFDDAVEELAKVVNHHLTEEELTILNPAREEVGDRLRAELGEAFATERNAQIDDGCGTSTHIRKLVAQAPPRGASRRRRGRGRGGLSNGPVLSRCGRAGATAVVGRWVGVVAVSAGGVPAVLTDDSSSRGG